MMISEKDSPQPATSGLFIRLVCLALTVAILALVLPINVTPPTPEFARIGSPPGGILPLTFGPALVRADGGLTITKQVYPTALTQGGTLTYTLIITNQTPDPLRAIIVQDNVPANTTCASLDAPSGWYTLPSNNCKSTGRAEWILPNPPGDSFNGTVYLTYTVRVGSPLPDQTIITNAAGSYAITATLPTTYTDFGDDDITATVLSPDLAISKSATPGVVAAGEALTYTIRFTNTGGYTGTNIQITDTLPAQINPATVAYAADETIITGQLTDTLFFTATTLGPAQTGNITITANTVTAPWPAGGQSFTNPVTATMDLAAFAQRTAGATITGTPNVPYSLTVTAVPTLTRVGNSVAVTALIQDRYGNPITNSQNIIFASSLAGSTIPSPQPSVNGQAGAALSSAVAGTTIVTAQIGSVVNTTTVIFDDPALTVSKSVTPNPVLAGQALTYTIRYTYTGNTPATLRLTDTLPLSLTNIQSDTGAASPAGGTGQTRLFTRANMVGPVSGLIILTANAITAPWPAAGVSLTNSVTGTLNITETNMADNVASAATTGRPHSPYTLTLTVSPNPMPFNSIAAVALTAIDQYGNPVLNGQPVTFTTSVPGGAISPAGTTNNGQAGAVFTATISASGFVTATVGSISAGIPVTVTAPALSVSKTGSADIALAGQILTYTITFTNSGNANATGVVITDILPPEVTLVGASRPYSTMFPTNVISFPTGSVAPGTQTIIVTTTVTTTVSALANKSAITNTVYVSSAQTDTVTAVDTATVLAPNLVVSKVVTPNPVLAGETLTYTIRYTYTGSARVNIRLTDTLPLSLNLASVASSTVNATFAGRPTANTLIFTTANVAHNTSGQIILTAPSATTGWPAGGADLVNNVSGAINAAEANSADNQASATTRGLPNVPYTLTLVAAPNPAGINNTVAVTATLTDRYGNPVADGQAVTFTSSLAGSAITSPVSTQNGQAGAQLTSTAAGQTTVTASAGGISATTVVTFTAPALSVSKTVNTDYAIPGSPLVYTIIITNSGDANATGVVVYDALPTYTSFQSATPTPSRNVGNVYFFNLGTVAPGPASTIVLTAAVSAAAPNHSLLVNEVTVDSTELPDVTTAATATVSALNLVVSKSVTPSQIEAGEMLTYTLRYTNTGTLAATHIRLTDTLPLSLTGAVYDTGGTAAFDATASVGSALVFTRATLAGGAGGMITLTGYAITDPWPAEGQQLTNWFSGTIGQASEDLSDNLASAGTLVVPGPAAALNLSAVPQTTVIGQNVAVTASLIDRYGNPVANGQAVTFASSLAGSAVTSPASTQNGQAGATLSSTAPGQTTVTASAGGFTATTVVTFTAPALSVSKKAQTDYIRPGSFLVYTITLTNSGNANATGVVVEDTLPANIIFHSANPAPASHTGNTYTFNLGTVTPGPAVRVVITTTVNAEAPDRSLLVNEVTVRSAELPNISAAAATVVSAGASSLLVSKTGSPELILAGQTVTYTIRYTNTTGLNVTGLRFTDTLPVEITPIYSNAGGATLESLSPLVFSRDRLATDQADEITIVGRAITSPWPAAGRVITNAVFATLNGNNTPFQSSAGTEVRPDAPAALSLIAAPMSAAPGQTIVITASVVDQYGNPVYNGWPVNFTASPAGAIVTSPSAAANGQATATLTATVTGAVTVTASAGEASGTIVLNFSEQGPTSLFLPVILKNYSPPPAQSDLVVDLVEVTPAAPGQADAVTISVTIRNAGNHDAEAGFWVDLYLTETAFTPIINQRWNDAGTLGVAWLVPALSAGETVVLTNLHPNNYSDPADCRNYSNFTPPTAGGCSWAGNTNIFPSTGLYYATAQVDSWGEDATATDGNITESAEGNNVYAAPIAIPVGGGSKRAGAEIPASLSENPAQPGQTRLPLE